MHELSLSLATGQAPDLLLQGLGPPVLGLWSGEGHDWLGTAMRCWLPGAEGLTPLAGHRPLCAGLSKAVWHAAIASEPDRQQGHSQEHKGRRASVQAAHLS